MSNAIKHPEAWGFFIEHARNVQNTDVEHLGEYRVPVPDASGNFIYAKDTCELWRLFIDAWYNIVSLDAPTVRGKIQYIVRNF